MRPDLHDGAPQVHLQNRKNRTEQNKHDQRVSTPPHPRPSRATRTYTVAASAQRTKGSARGAAPRRARAKKSARHRTPRHATPRHAPESPGTRARARLRAHTPALHTPRCVIRILNLTARSVCLVATYRRVCMTVHLTSPAHQKRPASPALTRAGRQAGRARPAGPGALFGSAADALRSEATQRHADGGA